VKLDLSEGTGEGGLNPLQVKILLNPLQSSPIPMVWGQNEQVRTIYTTLSSHIPPLILQVHLQYIQPVTTLICNHSNSQAKKPQQLHCNNQMLTVVLPIKTSRLLFKISLQLPIPYLHMKQAQHYDEEHTATTI
jgi:hypothetical protein